MNDQVEANVTLFKNAHGNVQVALPSGTVIPFMIDAATGQGRYFTSNKKIERELKAAVENDNEFGIYIDPAEPIIDINAATPLEQLEKKIRVKLMAELLAGGKLIDAGISVQSAAQANSMIASTTSNPGHYQSAEASNLQSSTILVDSNGQRIETIQGDLNAPATAPVVDATVQPPEAEQSAGLSALEKLKLAGANRTS